MKNYNILDFGARKNELCTKEIQSAIDKCAEQGGGRVIIENGTYITGTIFMKSNVNLFIEGGAKLLMSDNIEDFPDFECEWDTKEATRGSARCLIYIGNCENASVSGLGMIDCNGDAFCETDPDSDENSLFRLKRKHEHNESVGRMIFVMKSKNITLKDFTMTDMAGGWGIWINGCEYVNVTSLKISCKFDYPNSDGVHINCSKNVFVTDCAIHAGDDAIIVRANTNTHGKDISSENVVVKGCVLSSHCNGIRIGWFNDGKIKNCIFSDIVVAKSNDGYAGVSIVLPAKSSPTDCSRNTTRIENLIFSNMIIENTYRHPIDIIIAESENVHCDYIKNIQFINVNSKTYGFPRLTGRKDNYLEDISFTNCRFEITKDADKGFMPRYVKNLKTDIMWIVE